MTDTHHNAAQRHERTCGKAILLGSQQRGNSKVAACLELAVGFDDDAAAQVVDEQGLVGLGHAQFPRKAGMFDAGLRRCAGATVMAADEYHVGMTLGDAGGDCANTYLGHQLDVDAGVMVGILEVVDQLGQVLD